MTFDSPLLLALAPVVGAVVGSAAFFARTRRIGRAAAWSDALAAQARRSGRWAPILLGLVGLAAGVGLSGPRGGQATVKAESRSLSVVFAMDISRSMLAEDTKPSRLERAAREARRLTLDLTRDRLGLLVFAGRSYILSPLTLDGGAIVLFLDALSPDLASQGGTGLASALNQGAGLLNASREAGDRVLVVFTDGEAHDSVATVLAEARALREQGIRLVLVAEGGTAPALIPLRDSSGAITEYKTDEAGKPVQTRRRDDILQQIADAGEGILVPADLEDQASAVRELLGAFERAPARGTATQDLVSLVWIPALVAALLIAAQTATRRTAALVGIAALLLASSATAQRPAAGTREFARGEMKRAAALMRSRVDSAASDTAWYNAGTALLAAGDYAAARQALARAARALDPALRYRALYNGGVAALRLAATDSARRDTLLADADDQLRQALMLEPRSARAKWNLELAQRRRTPPAGGGSTPQRPPPRSEQPDESSGPPPPPTDSRRLTPAQAEQILNSVSREERETRARRLGKSTTTIRGVRDW